jgi:hypothetical protein
MIEIDKKTLVGGLGIVIGAGNAQAIIGFLTGLYAAAPSLFTLGAVGSSWVGRLPTLDGLQPIFVGLAGVALPLYLVRLVRSSAESLEGDD